MQHQVASSVVIGPASRDESRGDTAAHGARQGQSLVLIAVIMFSLLALAALVMDGGMAYVMRRRSQNAADAAALAGARWLYANTDRSATGEAHLLAELRDYARENGVQNVTTTLVAHFVNSGDQVVGIVGSSGGIPTAATGISVTTSVSTPSFFSGLLNISAQGAKAGASARVTKSTSPASLLALNSSDDKSLWCTGSGALNVSGSIVVDSNGTNAMWAGGSGAISASTISVTGGYRRTGSGSITPTPTTGMPPIPDPLASLDAPHWSGLPVRFGTPTSPDQFQIVGSTAFTIYPGIYYGGIKVTGSGAVTMMPGMYIMAGGGFKQTGSGAITGNGVFIYNTQDPSHTSGDGAYDSMDLAGSGALTLTPMTAGEYAGLLYFQDRNNDSGMKMTGSGSMSGVTGTLYAPSANVELAGSGSTMTAQFICDTLKCSGSGALTVRYDEDVFYGATSISLTR